MAGFESDWSTVWIISVQSRYNPSAPVLNECVYVCVCVCVCACGYKICSNSKSQEATCLWSDLINNIDNTSMWLISTCDLGIFNCFNTPMSLRFSYSERLSIGEVTEDYLYVNTSQAVTHAHISRHWQHTHTQTHTDTHTPFILKSQLII